MKDEEKRSSSSFILPFHPYKSNQPRINIDPGLVRNS